MPALGTEAIKKYYSDTQFEYGLVWNWRSKHTPALHFGYYDEEDEFFELTHLLTQEQKDLIPKKLQKVMEKVVIDEQGMRLPGNFLSK